MNSENLNSFVISDPTDIEASEEIGTPKKTYSLIQRKKIADRVENLKSKKYFKAIFKLVHGSCPSCYTRDGSGVYINFEIIPNLTIELVENYLNEVSPKTSYLPLPSKYTPYFADDFTHKDSGIKLSNHEKNFLKYRGNDSDNLIPAIDSDSSLRVTSDSNTTKTKIIIKPFTFE